jgi:hypothetical protein
MASHMKTTVDIQDDLLEEAKAVAARQKTTLRSLLEEGLRWVLAQRTRRRRFQLKDASVAGKGVQAGVDEGAWDQILDLIYRGRGS